MRKLWKVQLNRDKRNGMLNNESAIINCDSSCWWYFFSSFFFFFFFLFMSLSLVISCCLVHSCKTDVNKENERKSKRNNKKKNRNELWQLRYVQCEATSECFSSGPAYVISYTFPVYPQGIPTNGLNARYSALVVDALINLFFSFSRHKSRNRLLFFLLLIVCTVVAVRFNRATSTRIIING